MKIENIIKNLTKENIEVYKGEFDFNEFWFVNGTALVDLVDGVAKDTNGRYIDVINQIAHNRSHIYTSNGKSKKLTNVFKLGWKE